MMTFNIYQVIEAKDCANKKMKTEKRMGGIQRHREALKRRKSLPSRQQESYKARLTPNEPASSATSISQTSAFPPSILSNETTPSFSDTKTNENVLI